MHSPALHVGVEEERHAEAHAAHKEAQGHRIGVEYTCQRHCVRFSHRQGGVASAPRRAGFNGNKLWALGSKGKYGNRSFVAEFGGVWYPGWCDLLLQATHLARRAARILTPSIHPDFDN